MALKYPEDFINKIICGDCLEVMQYIPDKSIDMIMCDLPYGVTECNWDKKIDLEILWNEYRRVITNIGVVVLTATQPYASEIIVSARDLYKYSWYWEKSKGANFSKTRYQPLKVIEEILVFSQAAAVYTKTGNNIVFNAQKIPLDKPYTRNWKNNKRESKSALLRNNTIEEKTYTHKHPRNLLYGYTDGDKRYHSTQKPLDLFEYLIKTYTNEGDVVLDNCIGSGTTAIASKNTNRRFIGIELSQEYVDIANERLSQL